MKKLLLLLLTLSLALNISGCKDDKASATPNLEFAEFADSLISFFYRPDDPNVDFIFGNPEKYGITPDNPSILIPTIQETNDYANEAKEKLKQLKAFSYKSLDATQQITYDFIEHYLKGSIDGANYYYFSNGELGTFLGSNCDLPYVFIAWPLTSKAALERMIYCINSLPESFQNYIDFEVARTENGYCLTKDTYEGIVSQAQEIVNAGNDFFLINQLAGRVKEVPGLSSEEVKTYQQKIKSALKEKLIPAYKKIVDQVPALVEKAADKEKSGLAHFSKGKEYYGFLLKYKIGVAENADAIYKYLQKELEAQFKLYSSLYYANPDDEFIPVYFPNQDIDKMISHLIKNTAHDFPAITNPKYALEMLDKSMQENFSPAAYFLPPMDVDYQNLILVNPKKPRDDLIVTIAHETYPGHLYYFNYIKQSDLPMIRKALSNSGTVEGWAKYADHYSIKYLDEEAFRLEFNRCWDDIIYTLWAMTDIGINDKGWGFKETCDFWMGYLEGVTEDDLGDIFTTVQENPTNMLMYYYTYYQIRDYRAAFEKQLGSKYSDLLFHKAALDAGGLPVSILKKYLERVAKTLK